MKFTRVLLGVFALLLSGAAITLVSQEKSSATRVGYTSLVAASHCCFLGEEIA
jgi:VIT1/CCC1 family predicted Fe2+/Mn2+ transporter